MADCTKCELRLTCPGFDDCPKDPMTEREMEMQDDIRDLALKNLDLRHSFLHLCDKIETELERHSDKMLRLLETFRKEAE
jgi:hypothetical protein